MFQPFNARAHLTYGDRGFKVRLNINPATDYRAAGPGKIFFPDRSCESKLCAGPVIITHVDDRGSYGFFRGHMEQYEWPNDELLDEYIHHEGGLWDTELQYVESEFFGRYILVMKTVVQRHSMLLRPAFALSAGYDELREINDTSVLVAPATVIKTISVKDFIAQKHHGCRYNSILDRFVKISSEEKFLKQSFPSDKYVSDLMDEAVDSQIVMSRITSQNVHFIVPDQLAMASGLSCFTTEELDEIIKEANRVNMAANEQIRSLIKRGMISIGK